MKKFFAFLLSMAMVLSMGFTTVFAADATSQEEFKAAVAAAGDGDVITLAAGDYTMVGMSGKNITIEAAEGATVNISVSKPNLGGSTVVFNGINFVYGNVNYTGMQHSDSITYNDCTFSGQPFLYGNEVIFNNCEFNQTGNAYNVWTYAASVAEFNNCIFNSAGKSVLIYNESSGGAGSTNATFTGCTFNASAAVDGKAAIEIDSSLLKDGDEHIVTINGCTDSGFGKGSLSTLTAFNHKKGTKAVIYVDAAGEPGAYTGGTFQNVPAEVAAGYEVSWIVEAENIWTVGATEPEEDDDEPVVEVEKDPEFASVTAKILWNGEATESVEVKLLKNDKKSDIATLKAGKYRIDNWRYTWKELDLEDDWSIEVEVPAGYECEIDEIDEYYFEITLTQVKAAAPEVEEENPNTGAC